MGRRYPTYLSIVGSPFVASNLDTYLERNPPAMPLSLPFAILPAVRNGVSQEETSCLRGGGTRLIKRLSQIGEPIPEDLVPILTKGEEKQKQIREKTKSDAVSENAHAIGQANASLSTSNNSPQ